MAKLYCLALHIVLKLVYYTYKSDTNTTLYFSFYYNKNDKKYIYNNYQYLKGTWA